MSGRMVGIVGDYYRIDHPDITRYYFLVLLIDNAGEAQVLALIRI
jgi:ferritin-like metal-binding protein YciE